MSDKAVQAKGGSERQMLADNKSPVSSFAAQAKMSSPGAVAQVERDEEAKPSKGVVDSTVAPNRPGTYGEGDARYVPLRHGWAPVGA